MKTFKIRQSTAVEIVKGTLTFGVVSPQSADARLILDLYGEEMRGRYGSSAPYGSLFVPEGIDAPTGRFAVGYLDLKPVACGGLRRLDSERCEVKTMFVHKPYRRRGYARQTLEFLESAARGGGFSMIRLTTGSRQPEALNLYVAAGYRPIEPYNDNPYAHYWLEKQLPVRI